jgi:hypothetical protein
LNPPFSVADTFTATQKMCPGDPDSPPGTGTVVPCSSLPAPHIGPVQGGDTQITITSAAPGATIKIWVNGVHVATGSAPVVSLGHRPHDGDIIHVVQDLAGCKGQLALEVKVACVDSPVSETLLAEPFPSGTEYSNGGAKGTVYPAGDGPDWLSTSARPRSDARRSCSWCTATVRPRPQPSHYDYFQADLAKMGIRRLGGQQRAQLWRGRRCPEHRGAGGLMIDTIKHFQSLAGDITSLQRIDFGRCD